MHSWYLIPCYFVSVSVDKILNSGVKGFNPEDIQHDARPFCHEIVCKKVIPNAELTHLFMF